MPQNPTDSAAEDSASGALQPKASYLALTVGAIGVVYGDIGTSPLYAMRESVLAAAAGGTPGEPVILGILSLIIWALLLIVTVKYVIILLRADNNGEGGTLALMALAHRAFGGKSLTIILLGVIAAALFYGDAMLTPALSVLSAVEGLKVATPALEAYVVPLTIVILIGLFAVQYRGTARVAAFFGPITLVWFLTLAAGGIIHVAQNPDVLGAFNPLYGVSFMLSHGVIGFLTLGAVFLAVTGAEALYADLGHFGRGPIRTAWLTVALPALTLNYLGQGALLLTEPKAIESPFYLLYPEWALFPMVGLATAATVIASQAVITGAFSLTNQAIQLGLLPRMQIKPTSETQAGQIYIPRINGILLIGVLLLVTQFRSSGALASAYGIAVTGTMVVTAILAILVIWKNWRWPLWAAAALITPFLLIDIAFLSANLLKIVDGGWVPLLIGALVVVVMLTWRRGSAILNAKTRHLETPLDELIKTLEASPPPRISKTAIFLSASPDSAPTALLHSLKHFGVLHERNVILTVVVADIPRVPISQRVEMKTLGNSFTRIIVHFGFMEEPNVPRALAIVRKQGFTFDIMSTSFFLSRRSVRLDPRSGMPYWQDRLYIFLAQNADDASRYFQLPTNRVVEIGTQVTV
jgi:KUP system potassium uptake protein